jgi:lysozyme family protein
MDANFSIVTTDDLFKAILMKTLRWEGFSDFSDNPADHGGATKWGITQATCAKFYPGVDVRNLTFDQAAHIYRVGYYDWILPEVLSIRVSWWLFDVAVNSGPHESSKLFERALNVTQTGEVPWIMQTLDALMQFQSSPNWESSLMQKLNDVRKNHYLQIIEDDPTQEEFRVGWLRRAADFALDLPAAS